MSHDSSPPNGVQRLIQVTDAHLFADSTQTLVGLNCEESLHDVLDLITREESGVTAVLCTGDISQDHSRASYLRFHQAVKRLGAPQYWLAGNHDESAEIEAALGADSPCLAKVVTLPGWRVLMLKSNVAGKVSGLLTPVELALLERELSAAGDSHVLVCLHHNPVPVAAAWLQRHALQNSEELFAVLDRHQQVRAVLFGHIHQDLDRERGSVRYIGSPSTCIQFHPEQDTFTLDPLNPGYRWLDLYPDGTIRTGVNRVTGKSYPIDFSGTGY